MVFVDTEFNIKRDFKNKCTIELEEDLKNFEKLFLEVNKVHQRYPSHETEKLRVLYPKFISEILDELERRENEL